MRLFYKTPTLQSYYQTTLIFDNFIISGSSNNTFYGLHKIHIVILSQLYSKK